MQFKKWVSKGSGGCYPPFNGPRSEEVFQIATCKLICFTWIHDALNKTISLMRLDEGSAAEET